MYITSRPRSMVKVVKFTETHDPGLVSMTVLWGEVGAVGGGGQEEAEATPSRAAAMLAAGCWTSAGRTHTGTDQVNMPK